VGVVAEIERTLARLRAREAADGMPDLRTSTMTHLVWAPPKWLPQARATLSGLLERHPARTIFLIPEPGRKAEVIAEATLRDFQVHGLTREILSEVIEIRLRGSVARHPASIVLPLLISDLPAFCRWRGDPAWESSELEEITGVCDRLVVDSSEWRGLPAAYGRLSALFGDIAVSDIAFSRTLPWRRCLAELWPEIASIERLRVQGPRADAQLVAGWLRARLERDVALSYRAAAAVTGMWVDGSPVSSPGEPLSPSELLSAELDQFGRDPIYEAAVRATVPAAAAPVAR
jgi:glucose-6-phosphate dehydrogenase assembly protein OpcA